MSYLKSAPWNLPICKILEKKTKYKFLNLGPKIIYLGFFGIESGNPQPRISLLWKFCKNKQKDLNLGPKITYFRFSGLESEKAIVISQISTICKKDN